MNNRNFILAKGFVCVVLAIWTFTYIGVETDIRAYEVACFLSSFISIFGIGVITSVAYEENKKKEREK